MKLKKGGLAAIEGGELHRLFKSSDLERITAT